MVNRIIAAMIAIVIGLALLPVVGDFVDDLTGSGADFVSTTVESLIDLLPVLYVIILVAGAVCYVVVSYRRG